MYVCMYFSVGNKNLRSDGRTRTKTKHKLFPSPYSMLAQQRAGRRKNDFICSGLPEGTSDFTYTNHSIKYGPVRLYEIGFAYSCHVGYDRTLPPATHYMDGMAFGLGHYYYTVGGNKIAQSLRNRGS